MFKLLFLLQDRLLTLPLYLPSTLSFSRIIMAPILWSLLWARNPLTILVFIFACLTDLLDGITARMLNVSSKKGRTLDISADFLLLITGYTYYSTINLVSPLLLLFMSISFSFYFFTADDPVQSFTGKHVGSMLYVLLGIIMLSPLESTGTLVSIIGVVYIVIALLIRLQKMYMVNR